MLPVCCMEDQIKLAFCAQHRRKSKKKLIILFITILMCFTITKRSNSESSSGKFLHRSTRTLLTEERPTGDIINIFNNSCGFESMASNYSITG